MFFIGLIVNVYFLSCIVSSIFNFSDVVFHILFISTSKAAKTSVVVKNNFYINLN